MMIVYRGIVIALVSGRQINSVPEAFGWIWIYPVSGFRAVIVLRMIDGYSVRETAEILNIPEGTVASRLARAQVKLRQIFEKWRLLD